MAASEGDKYRSYLTEEDVKNTTWRFGPPNYDAVNKLFEEGRTKVRIYFRSTFSYLPKSHEDHHMRNDKQRLAIVGY